MVAHYSAAYGVQHFGRKLAKLAILLFHGLVSSQAVKPSHRQVGE
jgi:hypothetical protein